MGDPMDRVQSDGLGVWHNVDSIAGTPLVDVNAPLAGGDNVFGAFAAYKNLAEDYDVEEAKMGEDREDSEDRPGQGITSPTGTADENNKNITWITGRLDR